MKLQRRPFLCVGLVWLAVIGSGCFRDEAPARDTIMKSKDQTMTRPSEMRTLVLDIPPIDAVAPEAYQTATFGLG